MPLLDWAPLHHALSRFLDQDARAYEVLEFWLDTSVAKVAPVSPSVFLLFHAFSTTSDFDAALTRAKAAEDLGFLEDVMGRVSDQGSLELAAVSHQLASGDGFLAADGERLLADELTGFLRAHPAHAARFSRVFLHWAGSLELRWLRTPVQGP